MRHLGLSLGILLLSFAILPTCYSYYPHQGYPRQGVRYVKYKHYHYRQQPQQPRNYAGRLPQNIGSGGKTIVIDPRVHAWGAYQNGQLIRGGMATAGNSYCPDIRRSCRTRVGTFRINSLGSRSCKSSKYPLPRGGAPMPYCMFFNGKQGLHGSYQVVAGNVSHGCVRVSVSDAEWIRFNFANIGTRVIVRPY